MIRSATRLLRVLWAAPNTAIGLLIGLAGLATGGRVRFHRGSPSTIEFHGGVLGALTARLAPGLGVFAFTLGHVIIGRSDAALDLARSHELIHVRQYERWGPFFLPAYAAASLFMLCAGRHPYRDNPFEREAYGSDEAAGERGL